MLCQKLNNIARVALVLLLLIQSLPVYAGGSEFTVITSIDGEKSTLDKTQSEHIWGNVQSYLNSCRHYERVVGETYDFERSEQGLQRIKSANHLEIAFKEPVNILISSVMQPIEGIYVSFSNNGLPTIVTTHDGKAQHYTKCMGSLAIGNFQCDPLIASLFSLNPNQKFCKELENRH